MVKIRGSFKNAKHLFKKKGAHDGSASRSPSDLKLNEIRKKNQKVMEKVEEERAVSNLSTGSLPKRSTVGMYNHFVEKTDLIFHEFDADNNGILCPEEVQMAMSELMGVEIHRENVDVLLEEFDKDSNGEIDIAEFSMMVHYMEKYVDDDDDFANKMTRAVALSKKSRNDLIEEISGRIYTVRNILCLKDEEVKPQVPSIRQSVFLQDKDFAPAYAPSEMRCLALVSHNGMKATMKEFVIAHKNILKKFRLTGTNSTMTMLKEVFARETGVIFGPTCTSGPLGGDAELVALMCSGRLGGLLFFQDPMSAHPHQSDIDCLCRQALVHNTMLANTPTSAYMMMQVFRMALEDKGRAELIPSFFFSLQSPAVLDYKIQQKKVIAKHSVMHTGAESGMSGIIEDSEKREGSKETMRKSKLVRNEMIK